MQEVEDMQDPLDTPDQLELQAQQESPELQAQQELPDQSVLQAQQELRVQLVLDIPDHRVQLD